MGNLIFVYQAKSGVLSNLPGAIAKAFGGKSTCSLCNITNGPVSEKPEWERFLASLQEKPEVYHADEIPEEVGGFLREGNLNLPVVLKRSVDVFSIVASSADLAICDASPKCLIEKIQKHENRPSCQNGVCTIKK